MSVSKYMFKWKHTSFYSRKKNILKNILNSAPDKHKAQLSGLYPFEHERVLKWVQPKLNCAFNILGIWAPFEIIYFFSNTLIFAK